MPFRFSIFIIIQVSFCIDIVVLALNIDLSTYQYIWICKQLERKFQEAMEIVRKRLPNILLEKGYKVSNKLKVSNEPIDQMEDRLRPLLKFIDSVTINSLINNHHSALTSCAVSFFNLMVDTIFFRCIGVARNIR